MRPYLRKSIVELEQMSLSNTLDKNMMKDLVEELGHRNTPKAKLLLKSIFDKASATDDLMIDTPTPKKPSSKVGKNRPYQLLSIFDIEKLYLDSEFGDDLLRSIKHELSFRNVPKSKALLRKIEVSFTDKGEPKKISPSPKSSTKTSGKSLISVEPDKKQSTPKKVKAPPIIDGSLPNELIQAFLFFGLSDSASDDEIELARRELLYKYSPSSLKRASDKDKEEANSKITEIHNKFRCIVEFKKSNT